MTAITILGRGDDWKECSLHGEIWGTVTCLLTQGLTEKPFSKVFAFDGLNFPEIKHGVEIAHERKIPVISTLDFGDELYPLREICRDFQSSYLMNSISYMLAYAIHLKPDIIHLYGIGGRSRWDYELGKHYILFWIGVGYGRGIEWKIGRGSQNWLWCGKHDLCRPDDKDMERWHENIGNSS